MSKTLLVGATGMLGSNCLRYLAGKTDLVAQYRNPDHCSWVSERAASYEGEISDLLSDRQNFSRDYHYEWIVNAAGAIKPSIGKETPADIARTYETNTVLPHKLAAAFPDSKILSIQTDCVFSGRKVGAYYEDSRHDDYTVYGRSKSNGESGAPNVCNVRCSIIGREVFRKWSLVEWILQQSEGKELTGFTSHFWNGVSCLAYAKLCYAAIQGKIQLKNAQHWVPANVVNKFELVSCIAAAFGRTDLKIVPKEVEPCSRVLGTLDPEHNEKMWLAAGYEKIPTVQELVGEMAEFSKGI